MELKTSTKNERVFNASKADISASFDVVKLQTNQVSLHKISLFLRVRYITAVGQDTRDS